jgi:hypothetical protein
MFAEQQARYPRGTYKVLFSRHGDGTLVNFINLYTGRQSRPLSIWELIKTIDSDIASNRFPQNGIQYRSWGIQPATKPRGKVVSIEAAKNGAPADPCNPTFIVQVLYRQNATWQGTIQWIEGRQTRQYRSVNELLKLMDEALELTPQGPAAESVSE